MLERIVILALAAAICCFVLAVAWPMFEDDPPTFSQAAFVTGGMLFTVLCASFFFFHDS